MTGSIPNIIPNLAQSLSVLEAAGGLACVVDGAGTVLNETSAFRRACGPSEHPASLHARLQVSPAVTARIQEGVERVDLEGAGVDGSLRGELRRVDGEAEWTLLAIAPATEVADPSAAARYRKLYDSLQIGIYRSSYEGRPLSANPAFVRMMGYEAEADWLEAVRSVQTEWYVDPNRRKTFLGLMQLHGRVVDFVSQIYRHRTGEKIWICETARAIYNNLGEIIGFEGTAEDITYRVETELALERAVLQAQIQLQTFREVIQHLQESLSGGGRLRIEEQDADVLARRMVENAGAKALRSAARMRGAAGEDEASQLTWLVAELLQSRKRCEAASAFTSRFLACMSHELRTPLNAIIGYSEILQEDLEAMGARASRDDAGRVLAAARRLLHLVNDLLELARVDSGQLTLTPSNFPLGPLLRQLCDSVSRDCRLEFESEPGVVFLDQGKISRCVMELLSEADRLRDAEPIRVHVAETSDCRLEITVRVHSQASAGAIACMLDPLACGDRSGAGGMDLGLALARRLAEFLGGGMEASVDAGGYLSLRLTVPLGASEADAPAETAVFGEEHLLVVDDEPAARDLVMRAVEPMNYVVRTAASVSAALEQLHAQPACVVLDVMLPDGSGWDVLRAIRANPGRAHIPVLVHTIVDEAEQAMRLGADGFLLKPVERARLQEAVRGLMQEGRRQVA